MDAEGAESIRDEEVASEIVQDAIARMEKAGLSAWTMTMALADHARHVSEQAGFDENRALVQRYVQNEAWVKANPGLIDAMAHAFRESVIADPGIDYECQMETIRRVVASEQKRQARITKRRNAKRSASHTE